MTTSRIIPHIHQTLTKLIINPTVSRRAARG